MKSVEPYLVGVGRSRGSRTSHEMCFIFFSVTTLNSDFNSLLYAAVYLWGGVIDPFLRCFWKLSKNVAN
jgi:hypothetical protein